VGELCKRVEFFFAVDRSNARSVGWRKTKERQQFDMLVGLRVGDLPLSDCAFQLAQPGQYKAVGARHHAMRGVEDNLRPDFFFLGSQMLRRLANGLSRLGADGAASFRVLLESAVEFENFCRF
jgi:hypothetical protein